MRMAIALVILFLLVPTVPASSNVPGETDQSVLAAEDRLAIEELLSARVQELAKIENEHGQHYHRGSYSTDFRCQRVDQCQVTFHEDTASDTQLVTERWLLTLVRAADGSWSIGERELKESYEKMYRSAPGDEDFFSFDRFSFKKEGMEISAVGGSLFKDYYNGELSSFTLTADKLSYRFEPPANSGLSDTHRVVLREKHRELVFTPERVHFECDPVSCEEILSSSFTGLREASQDTVDERLSDAYLKWRKKTERQRAEHAFSGFHGLLEPDRRRWAVMIRRKGGGEHYLVMDYDNYEAWEVRVWGPRGRQPLYGYYSEKTRESGTPEWQLEQRPDRDGRDYEISGLEGRIKLALEDPEAMVADLSYRLRAKRDLTYLDFSIIRLKFNTEAKALAHPQLLVNSIQDGQGREMTWVRTGPISGRIVLSEPLKKGRQRTLRIRFKNLDCIYDLSDSYKGLARFGWLPFVRFGDMIHYFDLTVEVPARYKTLGIGALVSEELRGDVRITRWRAQSPVVFPTVIFGDYYEFTPEEPARKLDGSVIPVVIHVDKQGMIDWNIRPKQLKPLARQAVAAINFYRDLFQLDYPYGKMDLVNDPLGFLYGQSPSSIIYLGSGAFRGSGALVAGGIDGGLIANFSKNLIPHEIAHQWWGSTITNANMRNYWFVESLAEYSSALFVEANLGHKAYENRVQVWRRSILETTPLSSVQNAASLWSDQGYIAAVYNKGPYAFHMLRQIFGDEKFFTFFRQLARELAGREIVTRDIQRVAERSFGADLEWFFDQWIRGIGIPEYSLNYAARKTEDGKYLIEGKVLQRVVAGRRRRVLEGVYYRTVVPVIIRCADGKSYRKRLVVKGPETPLLIKLPAKPKTVVLNEHGETLALDLRRAESF